MNAAPSTIPGTRRPARAIQVLSLCAALVLPAACANAPGSSPAEERAAIMAMHDRVIASFEEMRPGITGALEQAAGYAVLTNDIATVLALRGGAGYGVLVENGTGQRTFMKVQTFGAGLGIGARETSIIMVFHDYDELRAVVEDGLVFDAEADAVVGSSTDDRGKGRINLELVDTYRVTDSGFSFAATIDGLVLRRYELLNRSRAY